MEAARRKAVVRVAVYVPLAAVVFIAVGFLPIWKPRYADSQPELAVRLLPGSKSAADVPGALRAARGYLEGLRRAGKNVDALWPGPCKIIERETEWEVAFKNKEPVLSSWYWVPMRVRLSCPGGGSVRVSKKDRSCRLGDAR